MVSLQLYDVVCSSDLVGQCVVTDGKKTVHLLPSRLRIILVLAHPHHHPGKEVRGHPAESTGRWGRERETMKLQDYKGLLNPRTFLRCLDKTSGTEF